MIIALQTLIFFRQSLLSVVERLLRPYYKRLSLTFSSQHESEEEEEEVFADFDDERGVVFFPPVYAQRYAAVSDCLLDERWCGQLHKVVDLGHHDMSFIKYLKEVPGVRCIFGVDIETIPLRCSSDLIGCEDYVPKRESPLQITLFQGNAADPDYRLIGCDAVVAIEMIEHMLPHDLERMIHTVFGFIKPWIAIFTTPNADFNALFKSMERNGLRRCDHFFEWTREQFHDWCSNIVARYPQFTVSCKGIGPGPPGTLHYGCCSQLALFINKDYQKQQDLNLNSLALVSNMPSPYNMDDMIAGWESPLQNMICAPDTESMTRLEEIIYSAKQSCMTIVITSPSVSDYALEYRDKTSQCNLDMEFERNFLMFDEEDMCLSVLIPRRKLDNRVYDMEDVSSRLNCTTYQVKKFSKTTQNLMSKNKVDSLVHTREVVDEIRHLTNLLNFKTEEPNGQNGRHVWQNINWGDNAPYWNQYYKIVREYSYPFETKSVECRMLDLISDEINRLIDAQCDEQFSVDMGRLEIPVDHLMKTVRHITTDVDKVKDLLEWNGYEVSGDVVIHSRLVVDTASVPSHDDDWPENDATSEWDTSEFHSTTVSDGSTIAPDYHGRALHQALDGKVRKLRAMMTADEDISTELDRVVCRLMKLALRTSKARQMPPPTRWMQCKLLDLLTLTEKAIARRKKHYIDSFPLKAIGFGKETLSKFKEDDTAVKIVNKYQKLLKLTENIDANKEQFQKEFCSILKLDDHFYDARDDDVTDVFSKELTFDEVNNPSDLNTTDPFFIQQVSKPIAKLVRTQAWIEDDSKLEIVPYTELVDKTTMSPSEHSTSRGVGLRHRRSHKKYNNQNSNELNLKTGKKSCIKAKDSKIKQNEKHKDKTIVLKKVVHNKSSSSFIRIYSRKVVPNEYGKFVAKTKKKIKEHTKLQSTAPNPIPGSIIELCHPQLSTQKNCFEMNYPKTDKSRNNSNIQRNDPGNNVAATEESLLIDIVMDGLEETIALRRTIGTDADFDSMAIEQETVLHSVINVTTNDSFYNNTQIATENVHSQTIFLYDINEPSTSKGVRHDGMDVQCGPDTTPAFVTLSPATSLPRIPKLYTSRIKIGDSLTNLTSTNMCSELGTSTNYDDKNLLPLDSEIKSPYIFTKGIEIGDSLENITFNKCSGTCTNDNDFLCAESPRTNNIATKGIAIEGSLNNIKTNTNSDFDTYKKVNNETYGPVCLRVRSEKVDTESTDKFVKDITQKNKNIFATSIEKIPIVGPITPRKLRFPTKDITNEEVLHDTADKNKEINNPKTKTLKFVAGITTDSVTNVKRKISSDFGTSTDGITENYKTTPNIKSPTMSNLRDSCSDIKGKIGCDFSASTDDRHKEYISLSPRKRSFGIRIKDSDTNTTNKLIDCATGTCVELISDIQTPYFIPFNFSSGTETNLLKPMSSGMKIEDSSSELYGSCSSQKGTHLTFSSKNTSDFQIKPSVSREVGVENKLLSTQYSPPKLSCGAVHIHSYREKQVSEDIVYQGEWQRPKSKGHARKKIYNPIIVKKVTDVTAKKKRIIPKAKTEMAKPEGSEAKIQQNTIQLRRPRVVKMSQEVKKTEQIKKVVQPSSRNFPAKSVTTSIKNVTKVASKITMSSILSKSTKTTGAVKRPAISPGVVKHFSELEKHTIKTYIPLYLTRRKNIADNKVFNINIDRNPMKPVIKIKKTKSKEHLKAKTENIKELIKFSEEPRKDINYPIFRNEIENIYKSASDCQPPEITRENVKKKNNNYKRSSSPVSQNSSTCSTTDSIATVRAVSTRSKVSTRRHSTSSNKSSLVNSESESNTPARNRKFTKRSKNIKKAEDKDNKENVPESSRNCTENESDKVVKSSFLSRNKNVFIAQVRNENLSVANSSSKHKTQPPNKSNIKIPIVDSNEKKRPRTATLLKKESLISDQSIKIDKNQNQTALCSNISNLVVVLEPYQGRIDIQANIPQLTSAECNPKANEVTEIDSISSKEIYNKAAVDTIQEKVLEICLLHNDENTVHFPPQTKAKSTESTILADMRQIVENQLLFLDSSSTDYTDCESDAINTSTEDIHLESQDSFSPTSIKTVLANEYNFNSTFISDNENSLNRSFDVTLGEESIISLVNTTPTTTNLDLLSFKSITSVSKLSEYYLADSELRNDQDLPFTQNVSSVRDIFERKELPMAQNTAGLLAIQAFSGFSLNAEPISGDQPDYVNLIDSETGSMALDIARLATSEELFVSGRSSVSYESCPIEEDAVVPNWLFQIISQQQSVTDDEEHPQMVLPMPLPVVEPIFDANGNEVEPNVGLGAGAGDGRGMHSDRSPDSSGRGSSLSSSETSSGQQSEAILIDPSAFAAQFELNHEPTGNSVGAIPLESLDTSYRSIEGNEGLSTSRNEVPRSLPNPLLAASDVDADVSSLDTDVVDSSDY